MLTSKLNFGFKGKDQLPLFLVWRTYYEDGDIVCARVIFNSMNWIGY